MLQQPLRVAPTHDELPQLRRVSAYMVCPSCQAALLPKCPPPLSHLPKLSLSTSKPLVTQPTTSPIPAILAAFRSHRWSASVLSTLPNAALLSLVCPSHPINYTLPSCLFPDPAPRLRSVAAHRRYTLAAQPTTATRTPTTTPYLPSLPRSPPQLHHLEACFFIFLSLPNQPY
jgi:hypothetical protein